MKTGAEYGHCGKPVAGTLFCVRKKHHDGGCSGLSLDADENTVERVQGEPRPEGRSSVEPERDLR